MRYSICFTMIVMFFALTNCFAKGSGGYLGFGIHYGTDKTLGAQISYGVALTSVGEPGVGPYLLPGIAVGIRRSFSHKTTYSYSDLQLTWFNGLWGGVGVGSVFSEFGPTLRAKIYGGFLIAGFSYETPVLIANKEEKPFVGSYLGLAFPRIGTHVMP